jgi:uncharacterized protein
LAFANKQIAVSRPQKQRCVSCNPVSDYFKPRGIPMHSLTEVALELDELEAIRLADLDGLYQAEVAARMGVSRQTIGNILERAHRKIADALIHGKALRITAEPQQYSEIPKEPT